MPLLPPACSLTALHFYWHLGDFRAMSKIDEELTAVLIPQAGMPQYLADAWPDFIQHQLVPFGQATCVLVHRKSPSWSRP